MRVAIRDAEPITRRANRQLHHGTFTLPARRSWFSADSRTQGRYRCAAVCGRPSTTARRRTDRLTDHRLTIEPRARDSGRSSARARRLRVNSADVPWIEDLASWFANRDNATRFAKVMGYTGCRELWLQVELAMWLEARGRFAADGEWDTNLRIAEYGRSDLGVRDASGGVVAIKPRC
jgi:hypothetical protein